MKLLTRYSLLIVVPIYMVSLLFFVFVLELVEVVTNLIRYVQLSVPLESILEIQYHFLPTALNFAIPIAMLFAVSFSVGSLHGNSELLACFAIGRSLLQFSMPIVLFALFVSICSFFLQDVVVTRSQRAYTSAKEAILLTNSSEDNEFVAIYGPDGRDIYFADFYDADTQVLTNLIVVERDLGGRVRRRINAERAVWAEDHWQLIAAHSYVWEYSPVTIISEFLGDVDAENFTLSPQRFANSTLTVDELPIRDAKDFIALQYESGLPYRSALTSYYRRFSFALTPLILAIIACVIGGILRSNTLLLSMILSLCVTVVYYVLNLITDLLAINGYVAPFIAAWSSIGIFALTGIIFAPFLYRS